MSWAKILSPPLSIARARTHLAAVELDGVVVANCNDCDRVARVECGGGRCRGRLATDRQTAERGRRTNTRRRVGCANWARRRRACPRDAPPWSLLRLRRAAGADIPRSERWTRVARPTAHEVHAGRRGLPRPPVTASCEPRASDGCENVTPRGGRTGIVHRWEVGNKLLLQTAVDGGANVVQAREWRAAARP